MADFQPFNLAQIYGAADEANARKQQIALQNAQLQRQGRLDQRADEEYGRQQQLRDVYRNNMNPDGSFNEEGAINQAISIDPQSGLAMRQAQQKQKLDAEKSQRENQKAEIDNLAAKSKYGRDLLASVTPQDYPIAIQHLKQNGFAFANSAPEQYDPQWVQSHVNDATTFISQLEKSKDRDVSMRGQDISMRGQDMTDARTRSEGAANRGVSMRGQDITSSNAANRLAFDQQGGVAGVVPAAGKPIKLTEDQGKATGWLSQANNAYSNIKKVLYNKDGTVNTDIVQPGAMESAASTVGMSGTANALRSAKRQQFVQASESMSEALLRAATGAGVNKDEAAQKIRELTPGYTDKPDLIKQKLEAIPVYLDSLKVRAGAGANTLTNNQQAADIKVNTPDVPKLGTIKSGYVFLGGDPAKQSSWKKQ